MKKLLAAMGEGTVSALSVCLTVIESHRVTELGWQFGGMRKHFVTIWITESMTGCV